MRYRYLTTALLLVLLAASGARAQGLPGYVLTLSGDTLHGTLTETPQHRQVRLRTPGAGGQVQQFDPSQIRGYGLRGRALIASAAVRRADGSAIRSFVMPQLLGPASLYAFADETGLLLQPPAPAADTLYELTDYNWILLLNRHLTGCPALGLSENRVLSLPFGQRTTTQLLTDYNRCLAPAWQPSQEVRGSAYRKSVDVEADFSYIRPVNPDYGPSGSGAGQRLLLARSFLRASGVQATVGLGYSHLAFRTKFYPMANFPVVPLPLAEQEHWRQHLLTGLVRVSQQLGKPNSPGLVLGLELGMNYNLRTTTQFSYQPLTGSVPTTQGLIYTQTGGGALHLAALAGVALPLSDRQQVRLSAFYQRTLSSNIHMVGLRASCSFFPK